MPVTRRSLGGAASGPAALALLSSYQIPGGAQAAGVEAPIIKLRLLETSDLHMFAYDYDYYSGRQDTTVGLTKVSTLIAKARAEARNCMLFDNGDILQGNPLGDYVALKEHLPKGQVHPMFRAMNLLGYDAAPLGNHEFNYGLSFLDASLSGAAFPFVCANLKHADGSNYLKPYIGLSRQVGEGHGGAATLQM